jgi:hypothetical protein
MATRNRMPPWHEIFKAPSGHELLIRPIRPEDGAPLQAAFSLFGPEEIRDRFLQAVTELSPETTQRLTPESQDRDHPGRSRIPARWRSGGRRGRPGLDHPRYP